MIVVSESTSTRKLIDVTITTSATGAHIAGVVEWYAGGRADRYEIDVEVPCVYSDDARYRVALCSTPPRLVLVEDDATTPDELCYLARWEFTKATDTCATVAIEVPRRVLVADPPVTSTDPITGETTTTPAPPLPTPTVYQVSTVVLPVVTPERTASRALRRRVRDLRAQLKSLKDAGTTVPLMTAAQRALVVEYVGLTGEPAPLAV